MYLQMYACVYTYVYVLSDLLNKLGSAQAESSDFTPTCTQLSDRLGQHGGQILFPVLHVPSPYSSMHIYTMSVYYISLNTHNTDLALDSQYILYLSSDAPISSVSVPCTYEALRFMVPLQLLLVRLLTERRNTHTLEHSHSWSQIPSTAQLTLPLARELSLLTA